MTEHRTDRVTAAVIDEALRLCEKEGIDSAIRYMEASLLDRQTILRVLAAPRFHREADGAAMYPVNRAA